MLIDFPYWLIMILVPMNHNSNHYDPNGQQNKNDAGQYYDQIDWAVGI